MQSLLQACSFDIDSNHYPVIATLKLKIKSTGPLQTARFIPDLSALSKPAVRKRYAATVFYALSSTLSTTTESHSRVQQCRALTSSSSGRESRCQLSWGSTTPVYCRFPVRVRVLGDYQGRCMQDQCPQSVVSLYASWHQVVSLHLRRWSPKPDQPTSTHGNYPGTASNPIQAYRPNGRQCRR